MHKKLNSFLEPRVESKEAVRAYTEMRAWQGRSFRRASMGSEFFRAEETRLKVCEWLVDGVNHKGSHFPICVFSSNRGHRSVPAKIERGRQSREKLNKKIGERRSRGGESGDPSATDGRAEHASWTHPPAEGWTWSSTWGSKEGTWEHWHVTWWRDTQ